MVSPPWCPRKLPRRAGPPPSSGSAHPPPHRPRQLPAPLLHLHAQPASSFLGIIHSFACIYVLRPPQQHRTAGTRAGMCGHSYGNVRAFVRECAGIRTGMCGHSYGNVRALVRECAGIRTGTCGHSHGRWSSATPSCGSTTAAPTARPGAATATNTAPSKGSSSRRNPRPSRATCAGTTCTWTGSCRCCAALCSRDTARLLYSGIAA